jgi:hypothetical protein
MRTNGAVAEGSEPRMDPRWDEERMEVPTMENEMARGDDLRALAKSRLVKRREFTAHIAAYLLVNASFVTIWAFTGAGFFWPVLPILGWGIGVFFHGWDTYSEPLSEARIDREVERLRRSSVQR